MNLSNNKSDTLLRMIRDGQEMTLSQQLRLTAQLSVPSIIAQFSSIAMQFIDASMVGSLGATDSAAVGLMSTTCWLFWGVCSAAATGFSVQVAHRFGAKDIASARNVLRQAITSCLIFSCALAAIGVALSGPLPHWLGGDDEVCSKSTVYFLVFALSLPILQFNYLGSQMLRCSGNMRLPSLLNVLMCVLDIIFNYFLIFPTREIHLLGSAVTMPGAGLGILGAALGTSLAVIVSVSIMMWMMCFRLPELRLTGESGSFRPTKKVLQRAMRISLPMGCEHFVFCSAQILTTVIVAPLGVFAIAANSFAITAESLCYMPGYGIADAATTLVGQSLGAGRKDLMFRFAGITVVSGMAVMTLMGVVMYIAAPLMIGFMTPDPEILRLGVESLRIEAFAEPMFAASIVAYGVFVGASDTLVPSCMNLASIWGVRLTLAAALAPSMGLRGVWIAMCVELCFRGAIFIYRLLSRKWMNKVVK